MVSGRIKLKFQTILSGTQGHRDTKHSHLSYTMSSKATDVVYDVTYFEVFGTCTQAPCLLLNQISNEIATLRYTTNNIEKVLKETTVKLHRLWLQHFSLLVQRHTTAAEVVKDQTLLIKEVKDYANEEKDALEHASAQYLLYSIWVNMLRFTEHKFVITPEKYIDSRGGACKALLVSEHLFKAVHAFAARTPVRANKNLIDLSRYRTAGLPFNASFRFMVLALKINSNLGSFKTALYHGDDDIHSGDLDGDIRTLGEILKEELTGNLQSIATGMYASIQAYASTYSIAYDSKKMYDMKGYSTRYLGEVKVTVKVAHSLRRLGGIRNPDDKSSSEWRFPYDINNVIGLLTNVDKCERTLIVPILPSETGDDAFEGDGLPCDGWMMDRGYFLVNEYFTPSPWSVFHFDGGESFPDQDKNLSKNVADAWKLHLACLVQVYERETYETMRKTYETMRKTYETIRTTLIKVDGDDAIFVRLVSRVEDLHHAIYSNQSVVVIEQFIKECFHAVPVEKNDKRIFWPYARFLILAIDFYEDMDHAKVDEYLEHFNAFKNKSSYLLWYILAHAVRKAVRLLSYRYLYECGEELDRLKNAHLTKLVNRDHINAFLAKNDAFQELVELHGSDIMIQVKLKTPDEKAFLLSCFGTDMSAMGEELSVACGLEMLGVLQDIAPLGEMPLEEVPVEAMTAEQKAEAKARRKAAARIERKAERVDRAAAAKAMDEAVLSDDGEEDEEDDKESAAVKVAENDEEESEEEVKEEEEIIDIPEEEGEQVKKILGKYHVNTAMWMMKAIGVDPPKYNVNDDGDVLVPLKHMLEKNKLISDIVGTITIQGEEEGGLRYSVLPISIAKSDEDLTKALTLHWFDFHREQDETISFTLPDVLICSLENSVTESDLEHKCYTDTDQRIPEKLGDFELYAAAIHDGQPKWGHWKAYTRDIKGWTMHDSENKTDTFESPGDLLPRAQYFLYAKRIVWPSLEIELKPIKSIANVSSLGKLTRMEHVEQCMYELGIMREDFAKRTLAYAPDDMWTIAYWHACRMMRRIKATTSNPNDLQDAETQFRLVCVILGTALSYKHKESNDRIMLCELLMDPDKQVISTTLTTDALTRPLSDLFTIYVDQTRKLAEHCVEIPSIPNITGKTPFEEEFIYELYLYENNVHTNIPCGEPGQCIGDMSGFFKLSKEEKLIDLSIQLHAIAQEIGTMGDEGWKKYVEVVPAYPGTDTSTSLWARRRSLRYDLIVNDSKVPMAWFTKLPDFKDNDENLSRETQTLVAQWKSVVDQIVALDLSSLVHPKGLLQRYTFGSVEFQDEPNPPKSIDIPVVHDVVNIVNATRTLTHSAIYKGLGVVKGQLEPYMFISIYHSALSDERDEDEMAAACVPRIESTIDHRSLRATLEKTATEWIQANEDLKEANVIHQKANKSDLDEVAWSDALLTHSQVRVDLVKKQLEYYHCKLGLSTGSSQLHANLMKYAVKQVAAHSVCASIRRAYDKMRFSHGIPSSIEPDPKRTKVELELGESQVVDIVNEPAFQVLEEEKNSLLEEESGALARFERANEKYLNDDISVVEDDDGKRQKIESEEDESDHSVPPPLTSLIEADSIVEYVDGKRQKIVGEGDVSVHSAEDSVPHPPERSVYPGYVNVRLSCYCNATVRALVCLPAWGRALSEELETMDGGAPLSRALLESALAFSKHELNSPSRTVLRLLPSPFDKGLTQQDAHEFLTKLWQVMGEENVISAVNHTFQSTQKLNKTCKKCNTEATMHDETFLAHSLSLDKGFDLYDMYLKSHTQDVNVHCVKCNTNEVTKIQRETIAKAPVLVLHLKRYIGTKPNIIKNSIPVDIPLTLGSDYVLSSVVFHHGETPNSGHYTCVGRAGPDEPWTLFDDMKSTPFEPVWFNTDELKKEAYLYFYTLTDAAQARQQVAPAVPTAVLPAAPKAPTTAPKAPTTAPKAPKPPKAPTTAPKASTNPARLLLNLNYSERGVAVTGGTVAMIEKIKTMEKEFIALHGSYKPNINTWVFSKKREEVEHKIATFVANYNASKEEES